MDFIIDAIVEWLKGLLVDGMHNTPPPINHPIIHFPSLLRLPSHRACYAKLYIKGVMKSFYKWKE